MCDSIFDFNKIVFLSFLLHLDVVLPQQVYCFMSTSVITWSHAQCTKSCPVLPLYCQFQQSTAELEVVTNQHCSSVPITLAQKLSGTGPHLTLRQKGSKPTVVTKLEVFDVRSLFIIWPNETDLWNMPDPKLYFKPKMWEKWHHSSFIFHPDRMSK